VLSANNSATLSGLINDSGSNAPFTKGGPGKLILSHINNTFGGAIDVTGGALAISTGTSLGTSNSLTLHNTTLEATTGLTLPAALTVHLNGGGTLTSDSGQFIVNGQVTGSGPLTINGSVKLGNNTNNYTVGTIISPIATLSISDPGDLGTGTSLQIDQGTLEATAGLNLPATLTTTLTNFGVIQADAGTVNVQGLVTGGGLVVAGTGIVQLSGVTNNYLNTTISPGAKLQISTNANIGTGELVFIGGTLLATTTPSLTNTIYLNPLEGAFDVPNTTTLNGPIHNFFGAGSLVKSNVGTLVLANPNSDYSGSTFINAGIVSISSAGNIGTSSIVLNGGTLETTATIPAINSNVFITSANGTILTDPGTKTSIFGSVTNFGGAGQLTKSGTGELYLGGSSSYTGGTLVTAGTLSGTTSGLQGSINLSGGTFLNFIQNFNGTYSGKLSGTGTLNLLGNGTVSFTGSSPLFTGPTFVQAGNLNVRGSLASSAITVQSGATLSGTGVVGDVTIQANGTLSPGNTGSSIGPFTMASLTMTSPSSVYLVQVDPLAADRTVVLGTANLNGNGTVEVVPQPGVYAAVTSYPILNATTVNGQFTGVFVTEAGFSAFLEYPSSSEVDLVLSASFHFFNIPYRNKNIASVGNNLNALAFSGDLASNTDLVSVIESLAGQNFEVVNNALDQMHPAPYSALDPIGAEVGAYEATLFRRRICCNVTPWDIWVEPFGLWLNQETHGMQIGFGARTKGVAFGVDKELLENWVMGIGGVYDNTHFNWKVYGGHGMAKSWRGAWYTDYDSRRFYIGALILPGYTSFDTSRQIQFTTINRRADANHHAFDLIGQLSSALHFGPQWLTISPYTNLDCFYMHQNKFKEHGADSLDLSVEQHTSSTFRSEIGLRLKLIKQNGLLCISPIASLSWIYETPIHRPAFVANFVGEPIPFKAWGWDNDL